MEKVTEKQIEEACEELQKCLIVIVKLDKEEKSIKIKQQKAQYDLTKARESIRNLRLE